MDYRTEMAQDTSLMLSKPVEVGDFKIVPVLRALVGGSRFGFLAALCPVALVVVRGEEWEVVSLKEGEQISVQDFEVEKSSP